MAAPLHAYSTPAANWPKRYTSNGERGPIQSELSRSLQTWHVNLTFTFTFTVQRAGTVACDHTVWQQKQPTPAQD